MKPILIPLLIAGLKLKLLRHLGGPGLILMGLIDSSVIPVPGSMDALTVMLAARHIEPWPYYALMATIGSVMGGYVTYRLALRGGVKAIERRFSKTSVERFHNVFKRWGFGAILVPAMLPPPVPMVPFVLSAGAVRYPARRFLLALTLGRAVRFTILGYLASLFGRHILRWFRTHFGKILWVALIVGAAVGLGFFLYSLRRRRAGQPAEAEVAVK